MMAFDGFVIGHHLRPDRPCSDQTVELMCRLMLGERGGARRDAAPRRRAQLTSHSGKSK
jgi:hypothetical protein